MHYKNPKKDDPRKAQAAPLKEAINDLLKVYRIDGKFNQTKVIAFWEKTMGKTIANRTGRIFLKDKTLFIEITSAPLKHELSLSKSKMIELINKEFGAGLVEDIVIL